MPVYVKDLTPPTAPLVTQITALDKTVSGTGEPGAMVTVIFPDGSTVSTPVDPSGAWTVDVPLDVVLQGGDVVKANQKDQAGNQSTTTNATVQSMADKYTPAVENEVVPFNGTYDLTNNITNSATLPLAANNPIVEKTGTSIDVQSPGAQNGYVTLTYQDGSTEDVLIPVTVLEPSPVDAPSIDRVMQNAQEITGKGVFGNNITLTLPDGTKHTVPVKEDGTWVFPVPEGTTLLGGQKVTAIQSNPVSGLISSPATATVLSLAMLYPLTANAESIERGSTYNFKDNLSNLASLPAGTVLVNEIKDITDVSASDAPNPNVVGTYPTGLIEVPFKDGSTAQVKVTLIVKDTIAPDAPIINQVTAFDTTITGRGEPGTTVTITFPNGETASFGPIGEDGAYSVNVPETVTLKGKDEISAVLYDGYNQSTPTRATVRSLADAYTPVAAPESIELGATTYNLLDNIKNAADLPLMQSPGTQFEDITPAGDINTKAVGDYTGLVKVYYKDGSFDEVKIPVAVRDTVPPLAPVINPVTALDKTVSGTGEPGTTVTLTFPLKDDAGNPTGEVVTATSIVGGNGAYTVQVPANVNLMKGDQLTATLSDGYNTSPAKEGVVRSMADAFTPSATEEHLEWGDPDKALNLLDNITGLSATAPVSSYTDLSSPKINVLVLGSQTGLVRVTYQDGTYDDVPVPVVVTDTTAPSAPLIAPVTAHDKAITGTGEPGASVVITFPDGTKSAPVIVNPDGSYRVDVPDDITLVPNDKLTAVQTDASSNVSQPATATVQSMASRFTPQAIREILEMGSDKALANFSDNVSNLANLPAGTKVTLLSDSLVDTSVVSETQSATVLVTYPDLSKDELIVPVSVRDTTAPMAPAINPVKALDTSVSGTGEAGAKVTLILSVKNEDGTTRQVQAGPVTVNENGEWTLASLPVGVTLYGGDVVRASQSDGYNTSPSTQVTVSSLAQVYDPTANLVTLEAGIQATYTSNEANLIKPTGFPVNNTYLGATVDVSAVGVYTAPLTITYADGSKDVVDVGIKVVDTQKPVIKAASATLIEKMPLSDAQDAQNPFVPVLAMDAGDVSPAIQVTGLPSGLVYNAAENRIEGTPAISAWGANEESRDILVTITATDKSGNQETKEISLTILRDTDFDGIPDQTDPDDDNDNIPDDVDPAPKTPDTTGPVIAVPADLETIENQAIKTITITATDDSGQTPKITVDSLPKGLGFDSATGQITGRPEATWTGDEESQPVTVAITATDASGNKTVESFVITILRDTDQDGTPDTLDTDDDGDSIPDLSDPDPKVPDTEKPVLTLTPPGDITVLEKTPMSKVTVEVSDNSLLPPTLVMSGQPEGVSLNQTFDSTTALTTGTIEGIPVIKDWGKNPDGSPEEFRVFPITFTATDMSGNVLTSTFNLTVLRDTDGDGLSDLDNPPSGFTGDKDDDGDNLPDAIDPEPKIADSTKPVIEPILPKTILETANLYVPVVVKDDSGLEPRVSISFAPQGVTYDAQKKAIVGTPDIVWGVDAYGKLEESRAFPILIRAEDATGNFALITFNLNVLRDTDLDGTPDIYDSDDDNDGIPDTKDDMPKEFTSLIVSLSPLAQTLVEGSAITDILVTENKTATQALTYEGSFVTEKTGGLVMDEAQNKITGTLNGLVWSDVKGEPNYETQIVNLVVSSKGANDTDLASNTAQITINRDTDFDGIPDLTDPDDDNDGIPDDEDTLPKVADTTKPVIAPVEDQVLRDQVKMPLLQLDIKDNSGITPVITVGPLPNGVIFDETTQQITGTPDVTDWGRNEDERKLTVTITATDKSGNVATEVFTILIERDTDKDGIPDKLDTDDDGDGIPDDKDLFPKDKDETAPTIDPVSNQTHIEGAPIPPIVLNPRDDSLIPPTVVVDGLPDGLRYDDKTGEITGIPQIPDWASVEETRDFPITITVTDLSGNQTKGEAVITILRDTDKDGIPDLTDPDDDNDNIPDDHDPEPKVPDTAAPLAPVINPVKDTDTAITGTGEPGATVTLTFPDGSKKTTTVKEDGTWSIPALGLSPGDIIKASQTDVSGNVSPENTAQVTDGTAPKAPFINPVKEGDKTITGTGEPGALIILTFPDGSNKTTTVKEDGTWSVTTAITFKAGDTITATQTDAAGNISKPYAITVGERAETLPPPVLPLVSPAFAGATSVSGMAMPEGTIRVKLEDGALYETKVQKDGTWQAHGLRELQPGELLIITLITADGQALPDVMTYSK